MAMIDQVDVQRSRRNSKLTGFHAAQPSSLPKTPPITANLN
jgi:hypothetical protein